MKRDPKRLRDEFEMKSKTMRNEFEMEREAMRNEFEAKKRKMTITFWKYVISAVAVISILGGYMIYRYGHIVTELYDSLIVYLNK